MPDPAITAAIIGAIATGATVASSEVSKTVRSAGGSAIGLTVTNESDIDFSVTAYTPNHGHFIQSPAVTLPGYFYEFNKFMSAVRQQYGPNPTDTQIQDEIDQWSGNDLFQLYAKGTTIKTEGKGDGMGFEEALLLQSNEGSFFQVAILFRKIPGGSYGVGIGVANFDFYPGTGNNEYGSAIINHIKSVHTPRCQYSDGGGSVAVALGNMTVNAAAPGEVNSVVIKNT